MRTLDRARLHDDVFVVPKAAMMRKAVGCRPRGTQEIQAFLKAGIGLRLVNAEARKFCLPITLADAEVKAPAGQQVQRCSLLG